MEMLDASDQRLAVLNNIRVPIWIFDVDQPRILWCNEASLAFWSAESLDQLCERDLSIDMSVAVGERLRQIRTQCASSGKEFSDHWTVYPGNAPRTAELVMSSFGLADGRTVLLVQVPFEIRDATSETLHSAQALLHTSAMISLYSADYELLYSNPAARAVASVEDQSLVDMLVNREDLRTIEQQVNTAGYCDIEAQVHTCDGIVWHSMNVQASPDAVSGKQSFLCSNSDITARRVAQDKAVTLAYTDSLTGLGNRIALLEHLQSLCEQKSSRFALLFLDLDRFKLINDSLGHNVGDHLLKEVGTRLRMCVSDQSGFVSRLGGDEFVVVLSDCSKREEVVRFIEVLRRKLDSGFSIEGHQLSISPSIGICLFPEHGESTTTIMQHADVAMYSAKTSKCGYRFFNAVMNAHLENRLELESDLTEAIKNDHFSVYYQPKISAVTGEVSGMEALIRWLHPVKGMISPLDFISIAEDTGQILAIGDWVMRQAMRQQSKWQQSGNRICISINISAIQIKSQGFIKSIVDGIRDTGCDASLIEFEITESVLLSDSGDVFEILSALSRLGIRLAIDDFGTGYSNLVYLQKYPLNCLKIDRAFLADMNQTAILEMILRMGQTLGLTIVAEGVETRRQMDWLIKHRCDELQGFFFSKPLPVDEATLFLRQHQSILLPVKRVA